MLETHTPCDTGDCPYFAQYYTDCEYWCGKTEPADDPEIWENDEEE